MGLSPKMRMMLLGTASELKKRLRFIKDSYWNGVAADLVTDMQALAETEDQTFDSEPHSWQKDDWPHATTERVMPAQNSVLQ